MELTPEMIQNIQIDYGIVYLDFGETGERMLGPTRGGAELSITPSIRDIDYDGSKGPTKNMQVVDDVDAALKITSLNASMDDLAVAIPYATYANDKITIGSANLGVIPASSYLKNITMFAKLTSGNYKKLVLFNPMNQSDFSLNAVPKGEGEISLEIHGHWDAVNDTNLVEIEEVTGISGDTTAPTATTVPTDGATSVSVSADLTVTFDESINEHDINTGNFILIKVSDGSIVPGTLSYAAGTYTATFTPDSSLSATSDYIFTVTGVRDISGNRMAPKAVNFTTA